MSEDSTAHHKPLLTVEQQIAHMKEKGITFNLCSEGEATAHLRNKCQFFRLYAYRKSFDKHIGGNRNEQYVGLDFGHLRLLSNLDRRLRDALLPMTLDVEHFAKVRLLSLAEDSHEDGYGIVRDYFEGVTDCQRRHLESEFDRREHDAYCGDLVRKYRHHMPLWVFVEVVSFGAFLGLMRFCADRWGDKQLTKTHYLLKKAKSVRNFCAHGACSLNDLSGDKVQNERIPVALSKVMIDAGIPKRLRSKRLQTPKMIQICTLLYVYALTVPKGETQSDRVNALRELFRYSRGTCSVLPPQNQAMAAISFLERLTRALGMVY